MTKIPEDGQPLFERDTGQLKIGNGVDLYKDLEYVGVVEVPPSGGGYVVQSTAPVDNNMIWFDASNGGILKYYDGSTWITSPAVWG